MIAHPAEAAVSLPSETEVRVTRTFNASRELVWKAYTTPELVQRWLLGPPGWTMPVCEMDVRPGGKFRWRWRSDVAGQEFGFHGEFLEVEARERIVHTEHYDPGDVGGNMGEAGMSRVTVTLSENGGVTMLSTLIDYGSKEARDGALGSGMTGGMELSYQNLDRLLAEGV